MLQHQLRQLLSSLVGVVADLLLLYCTGALVLWHQSLLA